MSLKNSILIKSLKWRIDYLNSIDKSITNDAKFIYKTKDMKSPQWLELYRERQIESDKIRSKIYACQHMIEEIKKDEEVELNYPSVIDGFLYCSMIAGCVWVLLKFAEFKGML